MDPSPLPFELAIAPFSVSEALHNGVSARRLRAADLQSPFFGVRAQHGSMDLVDLCRSLATRMPGEQYFSHITAAQLWGLPLPTAAVTWLPLHVSTGPGHREPRGTGVAGHRGAATSSLALLGDLPVIAASDAWCQLGSLLSLEDLIVAGDRLLGWPRPLANAAAIDDAIERFGARRGAQLVRTARGQLVGGSASPRETRLRRKVVAAGYPAPEPNGLITLDEGETHGDLVFRDFKVVLEYDGDQHRSSTRQFHRDVERLDDLAAAGWLVVRIHKYMTTEEALRRLDRALRSRGWTR